MSTDGDYAHLRKFVRAEVQLPVRYRREDASTSAMPSDAKTSEAIDLGGGGVRLATDEDLPLGTVLLLRFRIPTSDREMVMRGRIVLSFYKANEQRFFHGIAFTQIDPADQAAIVRYVEERAKEQPAL
ncbi:MAG: PilZ domain-containing protein [Candidatus Eremiobacteraeota bacterium]|nr:PilZ domain-containing protein [Candidatus Eremiobacteraeota bacterium]MBV9648071.1 PilZ domain-containing protein [Candidatus Eremiobacteraeota bacterium]